MGVQITPLHTPLYKSQAKWHNHKEILDILQNFMTINFEYLLLRAWCRRQADIVEDGPVSGCLRQNCRKNYPKPLGDARETIYFVWGRLFLPPPLLLSVTYLNIVSYFANGYSIWRKMELNMKIIVMMILLNKRVLT